MRELIIGCDQCDQNNQGEGEQAGQSRHDTHKAVETIGNDGAHVHQARTWQDLPDGERVRIFFYAQPFSSLNRNVVEGGGNAAKAKESDQYKAREQVPKRDVFVMGQGV